MEAITDSKCQPKDLKNIILSYILPTCKFFARDVKFLFNLLGNYCGVVTDRALLCNWVEEQYLNAGDFTCPQ